MGRGGFRSNLIRGDWIFVERSDQFQEFCEVVDHDVGIDAGESGGVLVSGEDGD